MSTREQAVVVTGMGMLTATGCGPHAVWRAVMEGRRACGTAVYALGDQMLIYPCHRVQQVPLDAVITEADRRSLADGQLLGDVDFAMLVVVASQAIQNSGLKYSPGANRVGLVVAHENPGVVRLVDQLLTYLKELQACSPSLPECRIIDHFTRLGPHFYNLQTFAYLFYLARILGIRGPSLVVNNACASGLYALEAARGFLTSGQADAVVVAASDYAHVTEYLWLRHQGFCSPSGRMLPFHRERDGAVLGDGAVAFVLERADQAERRGARPIVEYLGGWFVQDTWRMSLPDPGAATYEAAIRGALDSAGLRPDAVDLVVPHGTGSPLLDRYEAEGIRRVFGRDVPPVTALKPYVGHTLGASALLEAGIMIQAMAEGIVPPLPDSDDLDPAIRLPVVTQPQRLRLGVAMKTVSAFAGFTAAVLFRQSR